MELHTVQSAGRILCRRYRAVGRVRYDLETGRRLLDVVVMAHPADILRRKPFKQRAGGIQIHQRFAVFTLRRFRDHTAQHMHHQLTAIADAQDRHAPGVDLGVHSGRFRQIGAVRAAVKMIPLGFLALILARSVRYE